MKLAGYNSKFFIYPIMRRAVLCGSASEVVKKHFKFLLQNA